MADLNDTPIDWPAGIYSIEETDPVLGGAPNEATGAGLVNIPHQQLAKRTRVLKAIIDASGLGAAAVPLVTLNSAAARLTGTYRFASGDANTPATGVSGTVQVIAASAGAVNQTVFASTSTRVWTRFWNGTVWSPWDMIWSTGRGSRSFGSSGFVELPDGALFQYGQATLPNSAAVSSDTTVTLPTAFSNTSYVVSAVHAGAGVNSVTLGTAIMSVNHNSTTSFIMQGDTNGARDFDRPLLVRWLAIGS